MRPALHADDDEAPVNGDHLDIPAEIRRAHDVQHHVGSMAVGELSSAGNEILGAIVDAGVGTKRHAPLQLLGTARGHDHAATVSVRELNRRSAHAAAATVHQHGLAIAQTPAREECVVGGDEHLGNATCVDQVDIVRNAHHLGRAYRDQLCIAAAFDKQHDLVAGGEPSTPGPSAATTPDASSPRISLAPGGGG